jgi:hypothetical protein
VAYPELAELGRKKREAKLLSALRKAKVRMQTLKARELAANVDQIKKELDGVEEATRRMLGLGSREEKYQFMRSFDGIGEKYGRNVWMDIYDKDFRDTIAVDQRLKKVARALGFTGKRYKEAEDFYRAISQEAGLEPWALDRLLYNFTKYFLDKVGYVEVKRRTSGCSGRAGR